MITDKVVNKYKSSESFFSLLLGVIVVLVVGNQIVGFINRQSNDKKGIDNSTDQPADQNINDGETYVVKKGEYLYQIAEEKLGDGNLWPKIAELNKITNPDTINEGDKLILTDNVENNIVDQSADDSAKIVVPTGDNGVISSDKYTVMSNDSLWKICVRAYGDGYQWPKVAKINNLKNPDLLERGQVLSLPR